MKTELEAEGYPEMKIDIQVCYSILCFFLIALSIYVFAYHACNSYDSELVDKSEILDNFRS